MSNRRPRQQITKAEFLTSLPCARQAWYAHRAKPATATTKSDLERLHLLQGREIGAHARALRPGPRQDPGPAAE